MPMSSIVNWLDKWHSRRHEWLKARIQVLQTDKSFELIKKVPDIRKIENLDNKIRKLQKKLSKDYV